jgi:hypothetical protein
MPVTRFKIYIPSMMIYTQENLLKLVNKNIYFTIDNQIYTNEDINDNTSYLFSVFMFFDFFINNSNENQGNNGLKVFFNHKNSVGQKIIGILMNKLKDVKESNLDLNRIEVYLDNFWNKKDIFNSLNLFIKNIENVQLKTKLNLSLYYIIIYYDNFLITFKKCIYQMINFNNLNIHQDNIYYYFGDSEHEKDKYDVANILASMIDM